MGQMMKMKPMKMEMKMMPREEVMSLDRVLKRIQLFQMEKPCPDVPGEKHGYMYMKVVLQLWIVVRIRMRIGDPMVDLIELIEWAEM
jgi:hypothetical protein